MINRAIQLAGAAWLPLASPSFAQDAQASQPSAQPAASTTTMAPATQGAAADSSDEYGDEAIVITGAKPRGSVVGDIPPENVLDSRDVRATGATNISELLEALAPQIGSTQGRGGEQPVLLLNGKRISGFRELRDIPTEAIERVDIMPEEVALKYGYRADQKVVNIVLRQRFHSLAMLGSANAATEGGYAGGTGDLTQLSINRSGRSSLNLHATANGMLTENQRDITLSEPVPPGATEEEVLAARSLLPSKLDLRASGTVDRTIFSDVSASLNGEVEHTEGKSFVGLGDVLLEPLARTIDNTMAHLGLTMNGDKASWHWTLTGNADFSNTLTLTDLDQLNDLHGRARADTAAGDLTATANGSLFKLPAGDATTTITLGGNAQHINSSNSVAEIDEPTSLHRTTGQAGISLDLPISRRNKDFSALGNFTLNANAEVDQLSDFGTLTTIGGGANFSPVDRLSFITSWTREEGAPTIDQLGDPILRTPNTRIFDFVTGETAIVTAITGGNPDLGSDRRTVWKLSGNWQPFEKTDLRLRAEYVHQTIDDPISNITVTQQIEEAFPDRFVRNAAGQLLAVDLRPINFGQSRTDTLRVGFDFSKPLKSRRPSPSVIDQLRSQFGFGRGPSGSGRSAAAANGPQGALPPPPPEGGPSRGSGASGGSGASPGGGGFGGPGGGGRGFGGFGRGGFGNRGRLQFSLTDTITFVNQVTIAPGIRLDYLHGDAASSFGGTPTHVVQAQAGYFNNGLGARIGANWRSATDVNTDTGERLHFSPLGTFDLRLFAQPGDMPEIALKHPWLRGTQIRLEATNIFNSKPGVHDSNGNVPVNYQADLLDPLGRTILISFRKLFSPSPATIRREIEEDRARGQSR